MSSRCFIAPLLAPVFLIVLSAPAFAQTEGARLRVCNKGKVPVEVGVARSDSFMGLDSTKYWVIAGVTIQPNDCALVYDHFGGRVPAPGVNGSMYKMTIDLPPGEAVVGFGLKNVAGRFESLRATSVPDLGVFERNLAVLSRKSSTICVDPVKTQPYHTTDNNLFAPSQCVEGFPGIGHAVPLTTAYAFNPNPATCSLNISPAAAQMDPCAGGNYHLDITANPAKGEIDVTGGEGVDENHPAPRPSPEDKALERAKEDTLRKAILGAAEQAKQQEAQRKAAANPMNRAAAARAEFEARQNSIDYVAEHTRNIGRIRDLAQFTPNWLRTTEPLLYVRGTVSRVELPSGPRQPARLYFKESPDGAFVACIPAPAIFDSLQQYAGKYLEVRGRVSQSNCGGKVADVQVVNPAMIHDLANGTPTDEAFLPGMTVSPPPNKGGPAAWVPPPPGPDRRDRSDPAQLPTALPRSTSPAPFSGAAASPISPGARIEVTLLEPVDLVRANDGDTFRAQVLRADAPRGGNAPSSGSAVILRFARIPAPGTNGVNNVSLTVQSVTLNGRPVPVSSSSFAQAVPTTTTPGSATYRIGMRLFFLVSGGR